MEGIFEPGVRRCKVCCQIRQRDACSVNKHARINLIKLIIICEQVWCRGTLAYHVRELRENFIASLLFIQYSNSLLHDQKENHCR